MISKAKIKLIQSLKLKKFRTKTGLFVAEGIKTVNDLLNSNVSVSEIFALENVSDSINNPNGEEIQYISESEFKKISFLSTSTNVLGLFKIPNINILDSFSDEFLIVLDGVQDPGNMGTIIRLADWYGIKNIICSIDSADTFNPKVVQSTMGSVARVNVHYTDLSIFIQKAKEQHNFYIYGSFMNGKPIYSTTFKDKKILIMGNEGKGISKEIESFADEKINIPAFFTEKNGPESLNVAMATGIIVSEMKR